MGGSCELKTELTKLYREQRNLLIVAKNEMLISEILLSKEQFTQNEKLFLKSFLGTYSSAGKSPYDLAIEIHDANIAGDTDVLHAAVTELKASFVNSPILSTKMQAVVLNKIDPKYTEINLRNTPELIEEKIKQMQGGRRAAKRIATAEKEIRDINAKIQAGGLSKHEVSFLQQKMLTLSARLDGKDIIDAIKQNKNIIANKSVYAFPNIIAVRAAYSSKSSEDGSYIGKVKEDHAADIDSGYVSVNIDSIEIVGNTLDSVHGGQYSSKHGDELSTLAVLLGLERNEKSGIDVVVVPEYVKNSIKINSIWHMEDIYKTLGYEAGSEEFDKVWDLDKYGETYDDDYRIISALHQNGVVPRSLIIQSLGKAIYKSLPVKFSPEIDVSLQEKAITELGLYAINYMNVVGLVKEVSITDEKKTAAAREKNPDAKEEKTNRFTYNNGVKNQVLLRVNIGSEYSETAELSNVVPSEQILPLISALQYLDMSEDRNISSAEPITDPHKTIRNSFMDIPAEAEAKRILMQSKPLRFTSDMKNIWQLYKLNKEAAYALAGVLSIDTKKSIYNQEQELSKINYAKLQFDEMIASYEEHWDNEFYLPYDYTVSGRYMIDAILNPQESKVTRFLVTSPDMQSTLNVNKDGKTFNEDDMHKFKLSVAQAFDLDPDKKLDSDVLAELEKIVKISDDGKVEFQNKETNPFYKAAGHLFKLEKTIDSISDEASSSDNIVNSKNHLPSSFMDDMMEANREGAGMHAIQAIQALINLNNHSMSAIKDGVNLTAHVSNITIESDAITSGMILTLLGIGTKDALSLAAKGGVYTKETISHWKTALDIFNKIAVENGEQPYAALDSKNGFKLTHGWLLSFSKHVDKVTKENKSIAEALAKENHNMTFADFYNTVGKDANAGLIAIKKELKEDLAEAQSKYDEAIGSDADPKFIDFLGKQIDNIKDSIAMSGFVGEITRSLAKSPVMVYIYGSMLSSIKQKLTNTIVVPKIYEVLNHPLFRNVSFDYFKGFLNDNNRIAEAIQKGLITADTIRILRLAFGNMLSVDTEEDIYDEFGNLIPEEYRTSSNNKSQRPQFKRFNGIQFTEISDANDQKLKDLVISPDMVKRLKNASDTTLGLAFEEGFKQFKAIDDYRDSVKTLEVVRFSMFKYNYDKAVNKVLSTLKPVNGEYHISSGDVSKIIAELEKSGFGHSVNDINGGKQPLYKKEKLMKDIQAVLDLGNTNISSSSVEGKSYAPNTGASGVITVHNIDGYIDSTSSAIFNLVRIYDGSVSGVNILEATGDKYNEATMHATKWNSYNTQANLVADDINKMIESGDLDKMMDGLSDLDKDNLLNTIEKLMGYKSVEFLDSTDIDAKRDAVVSRVAENIAVRKDSDGNPTELAMLHSYVTDLAEPQVMQMSDGSDYGLNEGALETIYSAYGKMLKSLQSYSRMKKYGDETISDTRSIVSVSKYMSDESYNAVLRNPEADKHSLAGAKTPSMIQAEYKSFADGKVKPTIYIFADNMLRKGTALSYVKTPNTIGIPVKKSNGKKTRDYFSSDEDIAFAIREIDKAFATIPKDRDVAIPPNLTAVSKDSIAIDKRITDHIASKIAELKMTNTNRSNHEYVAPKSNTDQKDSVKETNKLNSTDPKKALEEQLGGTMSQEKLDEIEDIAKRCK